MRLLLFLVNVLGSVGGDGLGEVIEVQNETDVVILASACRSKFSGRLYVHIGEVHGEEERISPHGYRLIEVREVSF